MTDDTPPPEELARIETEKAKLRQQHLDAILARRNGTYKDEVGDKATMTAPEPSARPLCPKCKRPLGASGKCWGCGDQVGGSGEKVLPEPSPERPASSSTCPDCGRTFGKIRRCFVCKPNRLHWKSSAQGPAPAKPCTKVPIAPVASRPVPSPVEVREPAAVPVPARPMPLATLTTAVAALQGIVDLLAGLDDDVARWALESAYALSRIKDQETRP